MTEEIAKLDPVNWMAQYLKIITNEGVLLDTLPVLSLMFSLFGILND